MPAIAIFRTGGIGDVILSTVALTILRSELPDACIHWFGRQPTLELIKESFPEVVVHEFRPGAGYPENIGVVKNAGPVFDLIIDLQRSARTLIIGHICAAHFRCRYATWNKYSLRRSYMVFQTFLRKRKLRNESHGLPRRHEAMARCVLSALTTSGLINGQTLKRVFSPSIETSDPQQNEDAIAINLGALYESKELPQDKWEMVVRYIVDHDLCDHLHFMGDARKQVEAEELIAIMGGKINTSNHCGKTTLAEAARLLASCKCTLSNDSALSHLSESVRTPVIVFFGPTHEQFGYRPFLAESRSFSLPISCRPCTKGGKTSCRFGDFKCFHELDMLPALHHLHQLATQHA